MANMLLTNTGSPVSEPVVGCAWPAIVADVICPAIVADALLPAVRAYVGLPATVMADVGSNVDPMLSA